MGDVELSCWTFQISRLSEGIHRRASGGLEVPGHPGTRGFWLARTTLPLRDWCTSEIVPWLILANEDTKHGTGKPTLPPSFSLSRVPCLSTPRIPQSLSGLPFFHKALSLISRFTAISIVAPYSPRSLLTSQPVCRSIARRSLTQHEQTLAGRINHTCKSILGIRQ